ncbi:ATP synthase A1 subunit C [Candidatus Woesearchaeota archaeon CG10_big_fil_rev_8_21_14_0_10_44_13]|nr:MAG: ATP synthase A1 subunit C [Candidatus Woesearchaeota archaeon CG10_big_fil_rev_8_21_14_0_10_44_13]
MAKRKISPEEENKRQGKLKLKEYPYTYARICAMRAKLIKKDAYSKLLKMKLSEIAKFLQDTEYKKEIDELGSDYSGVSLIENALNVNLLRTSLKLKRITEDKNLAELIDAYAMRRDIWNIKTILRARHSRQKEEDIKSLVMPTGKLDESFFTDLSKKESVEEIVRSLNFIRFDNLKEAVHSYKEKKSLFELENAIDHDYYSYLLEFAKRMPKQGLFFREFVENEIDMLNLRVMLRLKKEKANKREIKRYLFYPGAKLGPQELNRLSEADDLGSMIKSLSKEGYGKISRELEKSKDSIIMMELKLNKFLLDRAALLLHQHPLSIEVILGYMLAKEIEIRNLKTIIKGKQLGMKEEFIESQLVIGG